MKSKKEHNVWDGSSSRAVFWKFECSYFGNRLRLLLVVLPPTSWVSIFFSFFFFLSFYFLIWEVGIIIPCLQASQNLIEHFQYSLKFLLYRKGFCGQLGLGSPVAQRLKRLHPLEKERATHSSTLAWRIPWREEPGRLLVHGVAKSQTQLSDFTFTFTLN